MGHRGALADGGVFDLDKVADVHVFTDDAVRPQLHPGADGGPVPDAAGAPLAGVERDVLAHHRVLQQAVGADHAARADHRFAPQDGAGQNKNPGCDLHLRVDTDAVLADKFHPRVQMALKGGVERGARGLVAAARGTSIFAHGNSSGLDI